MLFPQPNRKDLPETGVSFLRALGKIQRHLQWRAGALSKKLHGPLQLGPVNQSGYGSSYTLSKL